MSAQAIRVGIIGAGFWASYGHIPALRTLPEFEVVAVSARRKESARQAAEEFGVPHAYDNAHELIKDPDVDLVAVLTPTSQRVPLVKAAIEAGKDVYSEWPLTTRTADSEELLALAEAKGVRHVVGLQRRQGPAARYVRDLVAQGYVGDVRAARISVGVDAFPPVMPERVAWTFDVDAFTHVLSIYGGHFLDVLFQIVGPPKDLTAIVETHFPELTVLETGKTVPSAKPDEVLAIGTLENGGLFSVQLEGAQKFPTGLQIDITGTKGVLRLTNDRAFENTEDNTIHGVNGDSDNASALAVLPVPEEYRSLPDASLDESVQDLAHLYAAFARDKANGTTEATTFADAVRQHHLIDRIQRSSEEFSA
ncbi:Gfo/Idh/MocA family oxidoreductase [Streptomyces sp. NBC_00365]|uniref:Gfo/Idh/MocA family protein n=1 Tax=Streptomyces sp. NBC_00365 TaxID=2975726 RepID=UPI0022552B8A|nr:Gfo/Idh/MocA family oxidoreductase [Streptomyces sp. NBC_00365]MCX5094012.1 Gfo/Idh/MocA family oxidoreductase [Streptomyces sp. NBC_00365]